MLWQMCEQRHVFVVFVTCNECSNRIKTETQQKLCTNVYKWVTGNCSAAKHQQTKLASSQKPLRWQWSV